MFFLGDVGRFISMLFQALPPVPFIVFTILEIVGAPKFVSWQGRHSEVTPKRFQRMSQLGAKTLAESPLWGGELSEAADPSWPGPTASRYAIGQGCKSTNVVSENRERHAALAVGRIVKSPCPEMKRAERSQ
jgi:hypothetical protein